MGGYIGGRSVVLSTTAANVQDVTATDTTPEVTIINNTHEDTDGGREGKVIFKGQQSGGEESTLAEIQGSHDGTADDEKGDLIFKTNDGSDGASPTEAMRIDSSQNVGIGCVPNSIQSGFDTLQIGGNLTLNVDSTGAGAGAYMGNNVYRDSGNSRWEYSYTDEASQYLQAGGEHIWRYAASGTADTAITWSEAMRIHDNGTVSIGTTSETPVGGNVQGLSFRAQYGELQVSSEGSSGAPLYLNRLTSDGIIAVFRKDNTTVGEIGATSGRIGIGSGDTGVYFNNTIDALIPSDPSGGFSNRDNAIDLGVSGVRFDDIYATNGTIQTSDETEKQNIASLTSAEITAATAISKLFKTFKWKDKVVAKGDNARTHTGVVAQQVQSAMSDAGLDAGNYAFFISTTWWETQTEVAAVEADEENNIEAKAAYTRTDSYETADEAPEGATERNRKGIRYPELLAFIGAATEQRLTSIESRLTALEAG